MLHLHLLLAAAAALLVGIGTRGAKEQYLARLWDVNGEKKTIMIRDRQSSCARAPLLHPPCRRRGAPLPCQGTAGTE